MKKILSDLIEIKGGKRIPKGVMLESTPTNHPYITVKDMAPYKTELNGTFEYVPNDVFPIIKNYVVKSGDIILSIVGTIGRVSVVGETLDKASLTENCAKLIPNNLILPLYLFYFLASPFGQREINKGVVGSTQPKLPFYNIGRIEIDLPTLTLQQHIVGTTSSLQ